jgi:hypothetical protein
MKLKEVKKWGIDIGNVLIQNGSYTSYSTIDDMKYIQDSLVGLKFIIDTVGSDNVWLISKVSPEQQKLTEIILDKFEIYSQTGLDRNHVKFCLERLDKAPIIKELGLEGHIDDRGEIIDSLQNFLPYPVWFNAEPSDYYKWNCKLKDEIPLFDSWKEFLSDDEWK